MNSLMNSGRDKIGKPFEKYIHSSPLLSKNPNGSRHSSKDILPYFVIF
jgi:hypothetical protein